MAIDTNNPVPQPIEPNVPNTQNKKWLIILGLIGGGIFLLIVLFLVFSQRANQTPKPQVINPNQERIVPTVVPYHSQIFNPDNIAWQAHKTGKYEVRYPSDWKPQEILILNGGTSFTVHPSSAASNDFFPRIDIEIFPSNPQVTMQDRIKPLAWMKLHETRTVFHGVSGLMLSGRLPIKFDVGNPENKPVHKTYIYLEKEGYIYVIKYSHYEDADTQRSLGIINATLNSFTFR